MNAKTYLRKIAWDEIKMDQRKFQLKGLTGSYDYIHGIDYAKDKVQSSPHDSLADAVVRELMKLERLRQEILTDIAQYEADRDKIIRQIQDMERPEHSALLFKRYVEHKEFLPISREMGYTRDYVVNMHGIALRAFAARYLETEENPGA